MGRKKKSFIDKKNSVTFKLVARNQDDPLFLDETAPQYVLVEKKTKQEVELERTERIQTNFSDNKKKLDPKERKGEQHKYGIYFDDDYDYLQHLVDVKEVPSVSLAIEQKTSQQLDVDKPKLMLPSSVFASSIQEKDDLIKKAALPVGPQLDWDPDIVEAMDEDFDYQDPNNQIDDDFILQAMDTNVTEEECPFESDYKFDFAYNKLEKISEEKDGEDYGSELSDSGDNSDDNLSVCGYNGSDEDDDDYEEAFDRFDPNDTNMKKMMAKKNFKKYFGLDDDDDFGDNMTMKTTGSTHFTEYSMSSSNVPRNDNLKLLDERFEQMFISEYADDTTIGALDSEDIEGRIDPNTSQLMSSLVDEYEFAQGGPLLYEKNPDAIEYVRKYLQQIEAKSSGSSSDTEYEEIEIVDTGRKGDKDRFDCESVLSTASNTMYRPKILNDTDRYGNPFLSRKQAKANHIRIDPKTGIPMLRSNELSARSLAALDRQQNYDDLEGRTTRTDMSRISQLSTRGKNETPEERRQRKKELKEFRAQRRIEKKANREAFSEEKIRLHKTELNKVVQKKVAVI